MWDRRLAPRTPVDGLYLCGAATHPGGSVIGLNGRNAAMALLAGRVAGSRSESGLSASRAPTAVSRGGGFLASRLDLQDRPLRTEV